jgi:hypothetical protein
VTDRDRRPTSPYELVGIDDGAPHWFGVPPPPQVWPAGQSFPQSSVAPQPSSTSPHAAPSAAHVVGVHAVAPH